MVTRSTANSYSDTCACFFFSCTLRQTLESASTANPQTKNLDFRGFDSSILLILGCGFPKFKGIPQKPRLRDS